MLSVSTINWAWETLKFLVLESEKTCHSPDFHAGHYKKAEIYSNLKYWEYNINGQCIKCNINEDGNVTEYGHRLPDRIGKDKAQEVEQMAKDFKKMNWKWDREELKKIKKSYQYKIKQLKQNETN